MTIAGLRLSYISNGVSQLHGMTARSMWRGNDGTAPIIAVTNGVHQKHGNTPNQSLLSNPRQSKRPHMNAKQQLVKYVEDKTNVKLDPDNLIVGFCQRSAAYNEAVYYSTIWRSLNPFSKKVIQLVYSANPIPWTCG